VQEFLKGIFVAEYSRFFGHQYARNMGKKNGTSGFCGQPPPPAVIEYGDAEMRISVSAYFAIAWIYVAHACTELLITVPPETFRYCV
jgi:hypothetical protein